MSTDYDTLRFRAEYAKAMTDPRDRLAEIDFTPELFRSDLLHDWNARDRAARRRRIRELDEEMRRAGVSCGVRRAIGELLTDLANATVAAEAKIARLEQRLDRLEADRR